MIEDNDIATQRRKLRGTESESCSVVSSSLWPMDCICIVHGILQARILEWLAFLFYRGFFPTKKLNLGLLRCRRILYQLSLEGSPKILEWIAYPFSSRASQPIAYPFSSRASQPRNWTGVSCIAGRFCSNWAIRETEGFSKAISSLISYWPDNY